MPGVEEQVIWNKRSDPIVRRVPMADKYGGSQKAKEICLLVVDWSRNWVFEQKKGVPVINKRIFQ